MSVSFREDLPDVQEWSGGPLRCPGVVGRLSRMTGSGREALLDVRDGRDALLDVRKWPGGPPLSMGVVGRPTRKSVSVREDLLEVQKW